MNENSMLPLSNKRSINVRISYSQFKLAWYYINLFMYLGVTQYIQVMYSVQFRKIVANRMNDIYNFTCYKNAETWVPFSGHLSNNKLCNYELVVLNVITRITQSQLLHKIGYKNVRRNNICTCTFVQVFHEHD